ncbi:uncharacterized protein UV8b_06131 [Ustilaginoidea virens]|uniref:Uncharacterized protein n=1 Tax=Ustilaginoidea virens TaxID=1159556 RepID=A0A8E5HUJ1_USTVR|nr:uncharacterized protein UV8b_06131 [Ustilaginoidea virens]QUC21890.1 hypothetical protein UV8b_06131 [Ustilaginoidea virens]
MSISLESLALDAANSDGDNHEYGMLDSIGYGLFTSQDSEVLQYSASSYLNIAFPGWILQTLA